MPGIVGNAMEGAGMPPITKPQGPSPLDIPVPKPNDNSKRIIIAAGQVIYQQETTQHIIDYIKTHGDKAAAVGHLSLMILRELFAVHAQGPIPPAGDRLRGYLGIIHIIAELAGAAKLVEDSPDFEKQAYVDGMKEAQATGSTLPPQGAAPAGAAPGAPAAQPGMGVQ